MAKYTKYAELKQESEKKTKWVRVLSVSVILSLIAVVGLAINNSAHVDASSNDENNIVQLKEENNKLTTNLEKLQASFVEIDTKKKELESQKVELLDTIDSLNQDKENNLGEIDRLKGEVASLESNIAELEIELEEVRQNLVQGNVRLVVPTDPLTATVDDLQYLHLLGDVTAFDENGNQTNDVSVAFMDTNFYEYQTTKVYYMTGSGENSYIAEREVHLVRPFEVLYQGQAIENATLPVGTPINFNEIELVNNSLTFEIEHINLSVIRNDIWGHIADSQDTDSFVLLEGGTYSIQVNYSLRNKFIDTGAGGATVYDFTASDENNIVNAKIRSTSTNWDYTEPTITSSTLNENGDLVIRFNVFDTDENYIQFSKESILKLKQGYEYNVLQEEMTSEFAKDVYLNGNSIGGNTMIIDFFNGDYTFAIELNIEMIMNLEVE